MLTDFYRGTQWRALRKRLMLERVSDDGVLYCEYCHKPITQSNSCIGHHKIPLTVDNVNEWNIALNPENVQLVHSRCHNLIHEKLGLLQQKVYIVYGSPCSGKTYYVNNEKGNKDLVFDLDNIWQALTGNERYKKVDVLKPIIFAVKDTIYNSIQFRQGQWQNAWVIGTLPFIKDRELLCQRLGAELIYIKATKEQCLKNLENDEKRKDVYSEWSEYITEWFEDFQQGENDFEINSDEVFEKIVF